MSQDAFVAMRQRIEEAGGLTPEKKAEMLSLLEAMQSEVDQAPPQPEKAEAVHSVAGFASVSTHEALRAEPRRDLLDLSLDGLRRSLEDLEVEHPGLVRVVNQFCVALSNTGI